MASQTKASCGVTALAAACLFTGCMTEAEDPSAIGELEVPLTSVGSNGTRFALAGTFALVGPETITTVVSSNDATFASADIVTMNPRVGAYNLTLSQWALHRVEVTTGGAITGTTPVSGAILLDAATQAVDIQSMQTTNVVYRFAVPGGGAVVFARGTLNIDFTVDEVADAGTAGVAGAECNDETAPCAQGLACVLTPSTGRATCRDDACVKINEVAAGEGYSSFIELYNTCATDVVLTGASLDSYNEVIPFPPGQAISAHGYLLYADATFEGTKDGSFTFKLPSDYGVALQGANGARIDAVGWGYGNQYAEAQIAALRPVVGESIGRVPDGNDTNRSASDFQRLPARTPRASNTP